MINLIPLIYLVSLVIMLTPIALFLIIQIIKFNYQELYLTKALEIKDHKSKNYKNQYYLANRYINNQSWYIALNILENEVYNDTNINLYWLAKYHNALGFVFEQIALIALSNKHYNAASKAYSAYNYAQQNPIRLNKH